MLVQVSVASRLPRRIAPMLASTNPLPDTEERWAWEPKWDGLRDLLEDGTDG